MIEHARMERFKRMELAGPGLYSLFNTLTKAHLYFQGRGALRSMSVSDVLDNGSIEATFQGVRIKFELLPVFGSDHSPRGRVVCMSCHCTYGTPVQELLGSFTFGLDGVTDLEADLEGNPTRIDSGAAAIVTFFLDAAFCANRSI
ncbi:MAG: hypothetical protein V4723_16015 [Pseudomonadota bacterium]